MDEPSVGPAELVTANDESLLESISAWDRSVRADRTGIDIIGTAAIVNGCLVLQTDTESRVLVLPSTVRVTAADGKPWLISSTRSDARVAIGERSRFGVGDAPIAAATGRPVEFRIAPTCDPRTPIWFWEGF